MPVIVPPHNESRKIASLLTDLEKRMKRTEEGLRQAQLGNSSLSGGLNMYDANGNLRGVIGTQPDGTVTSTSINNPVPPPVMLAPTVTQGIATLSVAHAGGTADGSSLPADWSHLNVYSALASNPTVTTLRGTITPVPGDLVIGPLDYVAYVITVTSVNQSGKESAPSMPSSGTPTMVVGTDVLDGIVTELKLANNAVSQAKIQLAAVGTGQIAGSAVDLSKLANGSVDANKLVTGAVTTAKIAPLAVTGAELASNSVVAGKIATNAVTAGTIAANAVTTGTIAANAVTAGQIAAGTITATEMAANSIIAGKIAANAVTANEILANTITGGKIVADTITAAHLTVDSVTTAKIQALAVTANEIAANAITVGKIAAGAVTATTLETDMLISKRIIAGTLTTNRVEIHPTAGIQAFKVDGTTKTFQLNAANGNAFFMGEIQTAISGGSRIVLNPGGTAPDSMRLYQTATAYGEIFADPGAAAGTAAVFIQGSGSSKGRLGAYPGEAFTSYLVGTVSQSAASCVVDACNLWGGRVTLEGRMQYGDGRVIFNTRIPDGTIAANRELHYMGAGSGEARLHSPFYNVGLTFAGGNTIYVQTGTGANATLNAIIVNASSRTVKKNEKPIVLSKGSARQALRAVQSKQWQYDSEFSDTDPVPAPPKYKRKEVKRDADGKAMQDANGETLVEEIEVIGEAPTPTKPHFFPVAEDLLLAIPELVNADANAQGGLVVDLRDVIGFLWLVCTEQDAELLSLRTAVEDLKTKVKP